MPEPLIGGTVIEAILYMNNESMPLSQIIIDRIRREGPLSFRDFMEMALYYPGYGYYTSEREKLGEAGDFYTSPYLGPLFGEMIAGQLEEMWRALDGQPFTIVEYGAGTGWLCRDILNKLQENRQLYEGLQYFIIEKSPSMREREQRLLPEKVRWLDSLKDIPPINGCILSNELVDNFAVHQVVMGEGKQLMEVYVGFDNGFCEILRPASDALKDYFQQLKVNLPKGYRTEINLEATAWIQTIASALHRGFVLTIDYGHPSSVLYTDSRRAGTLVCYHRHRINHSPYDFIGEQDITHHVNFSALEHWGRTNGLECCGYTNQARFLQGLGLTRYIQKMEAADAGDTTSRMERIQQLRTLFLEMGEKFKVLIQRKGLGRLCLSGLQFPQLLV